MIGLVFHNLGCLIGRHVGREGQRCAWCHEKLLLSHAFVPDDHGAKDRCRFIVDHNLNSSTSDPLSCCHLESWHRKAEQR